MSSQPKQMEPDWEESVRLLDRIPALPMEERKEAVKFLIRNPSPWIRQRTLRIGSAALEDEQLVEYLREDSDDVLRNAGLEIMKLRGAKALQVALNLLEDPDPDVVLQAVLVIDELKDLRALSPLMKVLLRHTNPNVVQATLLALGKLGDQRVISCVLPFLKENLWFQAAAIQALGYLRSPLALRHLQALLPDAAVGSMAAEAIARIGGRKAFEALAGYWLRFKEEVETEGALGLLAHVLEGLRRDPPDVPGLADSLFPFLGGGGAARPLAARCLLALGPGEKIPAPHEDEALKALAEDVPDGSVLPPALRRRKDLIPVLLRRSGVLFSWGFRLVVLYPREVPVSLLLEAMDLSGLPEPLDAAVEAFGKIRDPLLASRILVLYLCSPEERRSQLHPLLLRNRSSFRKKLAELDRLVGVDPSDKLLLSIHLGMPAERAAAAITRLGPEERAGIVRQIGDHRPILRRLPWALWLEESPELFAPLAAETAMNNSLKELLPPLRLNLTKAPRHDVIRALGALRDRESIPFLAVHLREEDPLTQAVAIEALGSIGGPAARVILKELSETAAARSLRLVYRALAAAAEEEDAPFFRKAADNPDWYVRLVAAEFLGRFRTPENLSTLALLAADPVSAVAEQAMNCREG